MIGLILFLVESKGDLDENKKDNKIYFYNRKLKR